MDDVVATRSWFHHLGFRTKFFSSKRTPFVPGCDVDSFPDAGIALRNGLIVLQLRREWHESRSLFEGINMDELFSIHGGVHQLGY